METDSALDALAALAQPTRLQAFRLLVRHHPDGLPAGAIAEALAVPPNTLSSHLGVLERAALLRSERDGRSIVYRVDLDRLGDLVLFLVRDCCGSRTELCAPLLAELTPCRP